MGGLLLDTCIVLLYQSILQLVTHTANQRTLLFSPFRQLENAANKIVKYMQYSNLIYYWY